MIPLVRFVLYRMRDLLLISLALIVYMLFISRALPQRDQLAFIGWNPFNTTSTISLLDIERGLQTPLYAHFGRINDLAWSPDGNLLYFGAFRAERIGRDIATLNVKSGAFQWVTDFPVDNNVPAVSPDGRMLAFQHFSEDNDDWDVYLLDIESGNIRLLYQSARTDGLPYWTNDGQIVIVEQYDSFGMCLVYVRVADGEARTGACGEPSGLAWSPDGTLTAFDIFRGTVDIYIGDANAENWRRMTDTNGFAYAPEWAPNGRELVFVYAQVSGQPDQLFMIDLLSEIPRPITPPDTIHISASFRPKAE